MQSIAVEDRMDGIFTIGTTLIAAAIAAYSQYLFKRSLPEFKLKITEMLHLVKNRGVMSAAFLYFGSLAIYLFALRSGNLSFVYPTFASIFIFVFLISKVYLHERIGAAKAIGLMLVFIGVILVALT